MRVSDAALTLDPEGIAINVWHVDASPCALVEDADVEQLLKNTLSIIAESVVSARRSAEALHHLGTRQHHRKLSQSFEPLDNRMLLFQLGSTAFRGRLQRCLKFDRSQDTKVGSPRTAPTCILRGVANQSEHGARYDAHAGILEAIGDPAVRVPLLYTLAHRRSD
ncbi:hypothetical protein BE04_08100 [Sorangium cellulosum]|uniref:Uncharacterized protein n=2 Tax=Sorangium cellulosum TaxID=56 RepID=A0A150P3J4_SORCE|nr:hypothetical protein SCE1572_27755 [Sorangium cellulosum So0157-2]KYF49890.1 hypothetical protein BE04_08100 [Sorangium cellulosum]